MPGDRSQVCCQQDIHYWAKSDSWTCTNEAVQLTVTQALGHGLVDKMLATHMRAKSDP